MVEVSFNVPLKGVQCAPELVFVLTFFIALKHVALHVLNFSIFAGSLCLWTFSSLVVVWLVLLVLLSFPCDF